MSNFIKLNRKLLFSDTFSNPITLKVWIWILLKAEWKQKSRSTSNGRGYVEVKLKRGQLIFGRKVCASELEMSEGTLYRHISKLKDMGNIEIDPNSHYSIITVCKYDSYQYFMDESEQANVQPKEQANVQPTVQHVDTIEEVKESKEEIQLVKQRKTLFENGKSNQQFSNHLPQNGSVWTNGLAAELQEDLKSRNENSRGEDAGTFD